MGGNQDVTWEEYVVIEKPIEPEVKAEEVKPETTEVPVEGQSNG
jgi:hypothetical protein